MKFTKSAVLAAALLMATTGAVTSLSGNTTKVDAATVATVNSGVTAQLYNSNGAWVTDRALAQNTKWRVGTISKIAGVTMYQVATNEYLRASDSTLSGQTQQAPSTSLVATLGNNGAPLYFSATKGDPAHYQILGANSAWRVSHVISNGKDTFYEVGLGTYVNAKDAQLNMTPSKVETVGFNPYLGLR
ncbi:SLAP domain-containing protein [Companilactobacillus huachuanensis]|uniref:SLAP domain-containing protein n=1 Tax=Companilactobacillus huachuanensis TaxID=2559914 RepID=A0ABW1RKY4_9LACO|nr:SLAP domain-containing protein [Companilactobacillus huachuanensis]